METGRMTRSRAKALGATPLAAELPAHTPKTTGRRRNVKAATQQEQEAEAAVEKRLTFGDQPDGNSDGQDSAPPAEEVQQTAAAAAAPASDEAPCTTSEVADVLPGPCEVPPSPTVRPSTPETFYHDDPTVLLASPIIMAVPAACEAATSAAAPEVEESQAVEAEEGPAAVPNVAAPFAEMPTPSPPPAAVAHGTPMAMTPIPMASPIEQHLPEAAPAPSPLPMASPMSVMEEDPAADDDQPAPSPAPAMQPSPLPAGTPLSFMSDAMAAGMGPSASLPATPLSITASIMDAMGEQMSPFPAEDEELADEYDELPAGSPASFGQAAAPLTPGGPQAMDEDEAMMDTTPAGAAPSAAATPATFLSDMPYADSTPLAPGVSPMAAMAEVGPASVPHAAAPVFPRASDAAACFQGFTPMPESRIAASQDAESPAFALPAADPNTPSLEMEPSASAMQPAPASTPMHELAPAFVEPADEPSTSTMEDCSAQDIGVCVEGSMEQVAVTKAATPQASKATPAIAPKSAAKTPMGKSPLASKVTPMRTVPTPSRATGTKATPTTKPATTPSGPSSSYVYVESRYKTPAASTTPAAKPRTPMAPADVASTPIAPTTTTMGTKSAKRVSIQTPEGPRSTAPQRKVDLTPHHTKSASRSAGPAAAGAKTPAAELDSMVEAAMPYPEQEQENHAVASNAAATQADVQPAANAERRAKAAERLMSIHGAEQQQPRAAAPSYLAPTAAFSNKVLRSKIDPGNADPRSLNQIRREIRDAAEAKKSKAKTVTGVSSKDVDLSAMREPAKLTPKVAERQLPLVRDEGAASDEEAEYDGATEANLVEAMGGLEVAPPKVVPAPLRGLPAPTGKHLRFNETGKATESPQRTVLRGLPVAVGKYKRFN